MNALRLLFIYEDFIVSFSDDKQICLAIYEFKEGKRIDMILEAFNHRSFKNYLNHPMIELPREALIDKFEIKISLDQNNIQLLP